MENKKIPVPPKRPIPQKPVIQKTAQVKAVPPKKPVIQKVQEVKIKEEEKDIKLENKQEQIQEVKEVLKTDTANKGETKEEIQSAIKEIVPLGNQDKEKTIKKEKLNDQSRAILFGLLGGMFLIAGIAIFVLMFI